MDPIVIRALAKWPNVPAVYDWLALDRRGQWAIRSASSAAATDGAPAFERIGNAKLIEFIGRNYTHDEAGCWYFQNGPQRVYVNLDYTPLIYRTARAQPLALETHTGAACMSPRSVWMDERGNLLFLTEQGPGVLIDRDLPRALEALCDADGRALEELRLLALVEKGAQAAGVYFHFGAVRLPLALIKSEDAPQRLGYVREPRPRDQASPAPAPPCP
jgi:hypothetical protein